MSGKYEVKALAEEMLSLICSMAIISVELKLFGRGFLNSIKMKQTSYIHMYYFTDTGVIVYI